MKKNLMILMISISFNKDKKKNKHNFITTKKNYLEQK